MDHIRDVKLGRPSGWHNQGMKNLRMANLEKTLGGDEAYWSAIDQDWAESVYGQWEADDEGTVDWEEES